MALRPILPSVLSAEDGATAIEYGLIASLVVIALIAALYHMNAMMDSLYAVVMAISSVI